MKKLYSVGLIISAISVFLIIFLWITGILQMWENKFYNYKFNIRGARAAPKDIIIVGVDEESLGRFGRWPWPRSILARGIINLKKAGAKIMGIDIIFPEYSQNRIEDITFANALEYANCVVGASFFEFRPEKTVEITDGKTGFVETMQRHLILPIKKFQKAFIDLGFTNAHPDEDGVLRYAQVKEWYQDTEYFSFNTVIAAHFMEKKPEELNLPQNIYANFRGGEKIYPRYSFSLIYDGLFPREWVKDKIILIGSLAIGAFDHYPTPFEKFYPGVEFHATIIDNIMQNDYIRIVPAIFVIILIILFSFGTGQIFLRLKPSLGLAIFLLSIGLYFFILQLIFSKYNTHIDFLKPALGMTLSYLGIMGYRFRVEEKEKKWIKQTFSYYLSPDVVKELIENPEKLKLGGERKILTVLFSDIREFTNLAEKLNPEEIVSVLNEYLSAMTEIIFKYKGTLDKFIGDAIMSFWGAPVPQENHAELATFCAIDMTEKLKQMQEEWTKQNKPVIDIGVGINSGEMVVGNMGSNQRMDYTVIGDNVNLASRLETLTRQHNVKIIISEYTYKLLKDKVEVKPLGEVRVKGKEKPVTIFEVLRRIT